jgi:hypothetical protein
LVLNLGSSKHFFNHHICLSFSSPAAFGSSCVESVLDRLVLQNPAISLKTQTCYL